MHRVLERQLRKLGIGTSPPTEEQWQRLLARIDRAYTEADQDRYTLERALDLSSAEMRKRFAELRSAQGQLVEASRKAGRADVATSVLHNVGNVLNSVNVSANVVASLVRSTASLGLGKTMTLLRSQPKPGRFIDEDPKGQKVVPYLEAVANTMNAERETIVRELESLTRHIEHIKVIVGQQLSAAKANQERAAVLEDVVLPDLVDEAASILATSHVHIERDYAPVVVTTDRHKALQILVNLATNARDAVASRDHAKVTLRTLVLPDQQVAVEVEDNGVGIAQETLAHIFNQGFTTKPNGHGFGLHASACAAMELGGSLTAHSDGSGRGARLTLTLPRECSRNKPA